MAPERSFNPDPTPERSAPLSADALRRKLRLRLEHHCAVQADGPALTLVGFSESRTDVLRHNVDRPEDAVLEFVLPTAYDALGVLATSVVATPPQRSHRDGALAIGVGRGGDIVSLLATSDDVITTRDPQGWLIDACLRAVGLPTPRCDVSALAFPIALWLDRLMVAILNASMNAPVTWRDTVDLCPVPRRWRSVDAVDLGVTLASTTATWSNLRAAAIRGSRSPVGMTAARAAWMDDAMFARWCMGGFPDLANLRGDVEFLAPAQVAERVEITLRAAWSAFVG